MGEHEQSSAGCNTATVTSAGVGGGDDGKVGPRNPGFGFNFYWKSFTFLRSLSLVDF